MGMFIVCFTKFDNYIYMKCVTCHYNKNIRIIMHKHITNTCNISHKFHINFLSNKFKNKHSIIFLDEFQ